MTLSGQLTFNRVTGKAGFEDTTNYSAQGVTFPTDTAVGYLRLRYNIGAGWIIAYDNLSGMTPDVDPASDPTATWDVNLPLGRDGKPLPAEYELTYRVDLVISGVSSSSTLTSTYNYSITDTTICLDVTSDCDAETITSTDTTSYTQSGATISSLVRAHTLYVPPSSIASGGTNTGPANLATLIATPLWTLTWTAEVISTVTYLQSDGLVVICQFSGVKEHTVRCDQNLSTILCCLKSVYQTYESYLISNPTLAANYKKEHYDPTVAWIALFQAAKQVSNTSVATYAYDKILQYSGCTSDCECSQDISVQVQGTNSGNGAGTIYVVDSPDNSISVQQEVNGSVTTFHIQLSAALQAAINQAAASIVISTDTPSYITIVAPSAGQPNWKVNWAGPTITQRYSYSKMFYLSKNLSAGSYYLFTSVDCQIEGNIWADKADQTEVLGAGVNGPTDPAVIYLQDFFSGSAGEPPAMVIQSQVMRIADTAVAGAMKTIECEVFWFDPTNLDGDIRLRLYNPSTGLPYSQLSDLDAVIDSENGARVYISFTMEVLPYTGPPA